MQSLGEAADILFKEAGVAIKYRIAGEIYNDVNSEEYLKLKRELEKSERVNKLLDYLKNHREYHGATLWVVENSLNMLVDMGITYGKGFSAFDNVMEELVKEVRNRKVEGNHLLRYLSHIVVVPSLLRAGCHEAWLVEFVKERIDTIYSFIQEKNYDIYDDTNLYKRIPKNFQGRPIIRQELYKEGRIRLPLEYDIYGFACAYADLPKNYRDKVDEIISYIMDNKFQRIADGYGVLSDKKNYWALGWDPKPVDFEKEYRYNPLLLKMELLSKFEVVTKTEWFELALKKMESYKMETGLYDWPKNYLTEKDSCWILGNHMGVGENRRNSKAFIYEGTFRTLRIINNLKK